MESFTLLILWTFPPALVNILVEGVPSHIQRADVEREMEVWKETFFRLKPMTIAVLIGGTARGSVFTANHARLLAQNLNQIKAKYNASLLITDSRRTSEPAREAFLKTVQLSETDFYFDWRNVDASMNPLKAMVGYAAAVVVTGDLMSMIADSLKLGKPTYIFVPIGSLEDRHRRFILQQAKRGRVKPLGHTIEPYEYVPLDTTKQIVRQINRVLAQKSSMNACVKMPMAE